MKGIILAGGKGTRLSPLTYSCNKHLLMVGKEPMIYNPVKQLISAGIHDILITSSGEHIVHIKKLLGNGTNFGCRIEYRAQQEANGIAHAVLLAEDFVDGDLAAVLLGDNITTHSIKYYADEFKKQGIGAKVLLKKVKDPRRYGVAVLKSNSIEAIVEKPKELISNMAVTGIYFYDSQVFDIIRSISPSENGELEITTVNNVYLKLRQLTYNILEGDWTDAGTFESLRYANDMLKSIDNEIIQCEEVKAYDSI